MSGIQIRTLLLGLLLLSGNFATVWAQDDGAERAVRVLPLVFGGAEHPGHFFTTTFSVMNLSNTTIEVQVVAFADDTPVEVVESEVGPVAETTIRLLPSQAIRRALRPLADSEVLPLRRAWLLFRGPAGSFAVSARVSGLQVALDDTAADPELEAPEVDRWIRSDVQIDGLPPATDLEALITWDGQQRCFPVAMSSYTLVNPNREATVVRARFIQYIDAGNRVVHEARFIIPPATRIARLLGQIFPELFPGREADSCSDLPVHHTGVLELSSDLPINVAALSVNLKTGHFVDLPVRRVREAIETDQANQ